MSRTCTLKGTPKALEGPELKVGAKAPNVRLKKNLVESVDLASTTGRVRVLSVVPSVDTPVCAIQTKRFHQEAAKLEGVDIITVSCDLPGAQARFCGAEGISPERMKVLSDHLERSFGKAYGTLIPELGILCRAVFVVDKDDTIRHVEYVPEVASEPNYEAALACVRKLM